MPNQENIHLLTQLLSVIDSLSDSQFTHIEPTIYRSSIGSHVRHICDHYQMLLEGVGGGAINYDERPRDALIERNRGSARSRCENLIQQLQDLQQFERPLTVTMDIAHFDTVSREPSCDTAATAQVSSLGRELAFLHSHTVHHQAMISFIMRLMNIAPMPDDLGIAPATIRFKESG